jgi:hypothetical protein
MNGVYKTFECLLKAKFKPLSCIGCADKNVELRAESVAKK